MTQHNLFVNYRIADISRLPEMHVTPTDARGSDMDETVVWARFWDLRVEDFYFVRGICGDRRVVGLAGEDFSVARHRL